MSTEYILITKDSLHFKKGMILRESYKETRKGIELKKSKLFLHNSTFVKLNEVLTSQDERKIKDMIRTQLKYLFWQLYSKQAYMLGNL